MTSASLVADPKATPRIVPPARVPWTVDQAEDVTIYRYQSSRAQKLGVGLFLSFWLVGWSAGCVMIIREVILKPTLETYAFAGPFIAAWFAAVVTLAWILFGRKRLLLSPMGLGYESSLFAWRSRRLIPMNEIVRVDAESYRTGKSMTHRLLVETLGQPLTINGEVNEVRWLADQIGKQIASYQQTLGTDRLPSARMRSRQPLSLPETLLPSQEEVTPLSDSRLTVDINPDELRVQIRRVSSLSIVAVMLFLNMFWNGIVGVFLLQLIKDFQWFLFLFLIPFELIGLLFLWGLFWSITAPWWKEVWTFRRDEIQRRLHFLGIGRTRTFPITNLERIELGWKKERKPSRKAFNRDDSVRDDSGELYKLRIIHPWTEKHPIEVTPLTEGDARYLGDLIHRSSPLTFSEQQADRKGS